MDTRNSGNAATSTRIASCNRTERWPRPGISIAGVIVEFAPMNAPDQHQTDKGLGDNTRA